MEQQKKVEQEREKEKKKILAKRVWCKKHILDIAISII